MSRVRIAIGALSLSAAGFVGLTAHEAFTDRAIIPTKGDRPTVGFGSTFRDDGTPVQMGDTITVPKALARSQKHIEKDEMGLKRCVTADLHQVEYDLLVDHAYQYGVAKTCASTMVKESNAGNYVAACNAYPLWFRAGGRDCRRPENWGPQGCKGVWTRSLERQQKCLGAQ
ncbi:glycoside hydrolase family protein [Roseateles sp.]|uniref:glycoside hydrolase family protein n=1 Tax=Roseateles sp. TaxID=1971397 RepID=UPI002DF7E4B7|nr:glycoside hydrolase family protein [Roseateles sp.]HEV6964628.1 glycoside hydrolase family protein [Roseateles sp.]